LAKNNEDKKITIDGYFSKMVNSTGAETAQSLFDIARSKYF